MVALPLCLEYHLANLVSIIYVAWKIYLLELVELIVLAFGFVNLDVVLIW